MFRGINTVNLDAKGRIAVPTRYRDKISDECSGQMVVTIDTQSSCLLLYPLSEWEMIEEKLQKLPSFNPQARRIQRLLLGHATDVELDKAGRIVIPAQLREYASLSKKVVVIGQGNKFEIWDDGLWQEGREHWLASEATQDEQLPDELQDISL